MEQGQGRAADRFERRMASLLIGQPGRPQAFQETPVDLLPETPFLGRLGDPGLLSGPLWCQGVSQELHEPLHHRLPVGSLAATPLGHEPEHTLAVHTTAQPGEDRPLLVITEAGGADHVEPEGDLCVELIDVLSPWPTASRNREPQLLLGDGDLRRNPNHGLANPKGDFSFGLAPLKAQGSRWPP